MRLEPLNLQGAFILRTKVNLDPRGYFFKPYVRNELLNTKIEFTPAETFYSTSKRNVIRGMHFQLPPCEQAKLVNVVKGSIIDVLLDLRTNSPSYGKFTSLELMENDGVSIYIPKGIAHGFASKAEESIVLYFADTPYNPEYEDGIKYNSFGYKWDIDNPIISSRDLSFKGVDQFKSPFRI